MSIKLDRLDYDYIVAKLSKNPTSTITIEGVKYALENGALVVPASSNVVAFELATLGNTLTKAETQYMIAGAYLAKDKTFIATIKRSTGAFPVKVTVPADYKHKAKSDDELRKAFNRVNDFYTLPASKHATVNASQSALQNYITSIEGATIETAGASAQKVEVND